MKTAETNISKPLLKRRWVRVCAALLICTILLVLMIPLGTKYYLIHLLEKNGADSASIATLRFNPFLQRLTLGGVDVVVDGKSILKNSDMELVVSFTSLFKKNVLVQSAIYDGLFIDLQQYDDGRWRYGSYTAAGGSKVEEKEIENREEVATTWAFLADHIVLNNCTVRLKTPRLNVTFFIEEGELNKFTTRDGQPDGSLSLKGKINDEAVELQLDTVRVVPDLRLAGTFTVSRLKFTDLQALLKDVLPTFAGEGAVQGSIAISLGEEKGLAVDYDGTVELLSPAVGSSIFQTTAEKLNWQGKVRYEDPPKEEMVVLTDGILGARDYALTLPDSKLTSRESLVELKGKTRVEITGNVRVEHQGGLRIEKGLVELPGHSVKEDLFSWQGVVSYDSTTNDGGYSVSTDGTLKLGGTGYTTKDGPAPVTAGLDTLAWKGNLSFEQRGANPSQLVVGGNLTGGNLQAVLTEPELSIVKEKFSIDSKATLQLGEQLDIRGTSSFSVENSVYKQGQEEIPIASFGLLEVAELQGFGGKKLAIKDLQFKELQANITGSMPLNVGVAAANLSTLATENLQDFTIQQLALQKPRAVSSYNGEELVDLHGINITKISVSTEGNVKAEELSLNQLTFLGPGKNGKKDPAVNLGGARLAGVSWSQQKGLDTRSLEFTDLVAALIRDKDGTFDINKRLTSMGSDGGVPPSAQGKISRPAPVPPEKDGERVSSTGTKEGAVPTIKLGKVLISGNSGLKFEDYTLAVPFTTHLHISKGTISAIDSSQPQSRSEITLVGVVDKRAPLEIAGNFSLSADKPALQLKFNLKNYPLSSLSAYTVQSVGTALASGQLKLQGEVELADNFLKMENHLNLKQLQTKTISKELATELDNQLPIPLETAISVLQDSEGNIDLEIPLEGSLDDLDVGISDVLITALSKAIVPAASGYLMYALGPYGALAYVGMKVGENALDIKLPPVQFEPEESEISEEQKKYLDRIGKIMKDQPRSDAQLCPQVAAWEFMSERQRATRQDNAAVDAEDSEKLKSLGQDRGLAVQHYLAENYAIETSRLLICETRIETADDTLPAVILEF